MEYVEEVTQFSKGVGATAETRLEPLKPLIEYYEREMGEWPGRLMIATSFLSDVQLMSGWSELSLEFQQAVEQAQALVVSTMVRILNAQEEAGEGCGCKADGSASTEMQRFLDSLPRRE
jgi:predicted Abi (CAAX) family protease